MYNSVKYIKWVCNNSVKYTCKAWTPAAWRQNWNYYDWNCLGQNGWSTASCKIWNPQPVNGQCGIAKWSCKVGTSLSARQNWNYYDWSCGGKYRWHTAFCSLYSPPYLTSCTNASQVWKKNSKWDVCRADQVTNYVACIASKKDNVEHKWRPRYNIICVNGRLWRKDRPHNWRAYSAEGKLKYVWRYTVYKFQ